MKNSLREAMLGPSVLLLALSAISSGCQAASPQTPRPGVPTPITAPASEPESTTAPDAPVPAAPPATASPLVVKASLLPPAPGAGAKLNVLIEVKNTSDTAQTLHFTSGMQFDVEAFKSGEKTAVWQWSADRRFLQSLRDQVLAPGENVPFLAEWETPPAGTFTLHAKVTANGGLKAAPFEIVVAPANPKP